VDSHRPADWATVLGSLLAAPQRRSELAQGAVAHAREFSWSKTACGLLAAYREAFSARPPALLAMPS
jgi:D-inositol-3-phosphate glycosyltransferase